MKYFSLNHNAQKLSFDKAVVQGLAPDRGLYFPETIPTLPASFFDRIEKLSDHEIAFTAIRPFVSKDVLSNVALKEIVEDTLQFPFPLVPITNKIATLELFQGPTLAFKDVGARFMARCLANFQKASNDKKVTVLVATSGDTGGAVADGFFAVPGIEVVILYPKNKVSEIQEKQLTTLGKNISALEVDGTFDDCQDMVKSAFIDPQIKDQVQLTSANSINVARWLPQMFYYFFAYKALKGKASKIAIAVPSGNFGNLCAGLMGKKMGLPIDQFVACTNINDTVPVYLEDGIYTAKSSKQTISNAMDVGDPSNFIRIQKIFNNDFLKLKKGLKGYRFTDPQTKKAIQDIYTASNYICDPHGAVGYLGLKTFMEEQQENDFYGVFMETAHPIKFVETVEKTLNTKIPVPKQIENVLQGEKKSFPITDYKDLKDFLLSH
jgi:threonine synthase